MKRAGLVLCLVWLAACETEGIWHMPRASLERMQEQPGYRPYASNAAFADGRAMRPPPVDSHVYEPLEAPALPALDRAALAEGQNLYDTFCAVCHAIDGNGDTVVAEHMPRVKPPSLLSTHVRGMSDARLLRTAAQGYGMMSGFAATLSQLQLARIVAYVRALQLSQDVGLGDLPTNVVQQFDAAAP